MMAWHMRASLPNLSALLLGLTTAVIEAISNPFDVMQGRPDGHLPACKCHQLILSSADAIPHRQIVSKGMPSH